MSLGSFHEPMLLNRRKVYKPLGRFRYSMVPQTIFKNQKCHKNGGDNPVKGMKKPYKSLRLLLTRNTQRELEVRKGSNHIVDAELKGKWDQRLVMPYKS